MSVLAAVPPRQTKTSARSARSAETPADVPNEGFRPLDEPRPTLLSPTLSIAFAIGIPFVTGIILWFVADHLQQHLSHATVPRPFCCPEEARQLYLSANTALDPCGNFTGYVCFNFDKGGRSPRRDLRSRPLEDILRDAPTSSSPRDPSKTLAAFFRSCATYRWTTESLLSEVTSAIIRYGDVKVSMRALDILRFCLLMSVKYHIGAIFSVRRSVTWDPRWNLTTRFRLSVGQDTMTEFRRNCPHCIRYVLKIFRSKLGSNITEDDLQRLSAQILMPTSDDNINERGNTSLLGDIFESITLDNWLHILQNASLDTGSIAGASVKYARHLRTVMRILSNPANQPASIAFMVAFSTFEFVENMNVRTTLSPEGTPQIEYCKQSLVSLQHACEQLSGHHASSEAKDQQLREIYASVIQYIERLATSGKIFQAEDHEAARSLLRGLELLLPRDYAFPDVPLPGLTDSYIQNYFAMQGYESLAKESKLRLHVMGQPRKRALHLTLSAGNKILVPPEYYEHLREADKSPWLSNLPWLGTNMAAFIWGLLFEEASWRNGTLRAIKAFEDCTRAEYFNSGSAPSLVSALKSVHKMVLESVGGNDFDQAKHVWNTWNLSLNQFLFMRFVHTCLCDNKWGIYNFDVNAVLQRLLEFRVAFACPNFQTHRQTCEP